MNENPQIPTGWPFYGGMYLLVQLNVVGREETGPAVEASKPPVLIGEFLEAR
jgi:hypothetical protein